MHSNDIRISKYLSRVLRHSPESIGLILEPGGWVSVEELLQKSGMDRETLERVVAENDKRRYSFNEAGDKIRANQGHSVQVDLHLTPVEPPEILYHGTAERNFALILSGGLLRISRTNIHLSADVETAVAVGRRHGKPVVLEVQSGLMHAEGHLFYRSDNGVWLVEHVPAQYLALTQKARQHE